MFPVMFTIPLVNFPIHSYGFMLALSFLLGIWLSTVRAKQRGLNPETITDVGFYIILSAIVGARLYYVLLHFEEFKGNLTAIFNPFQQGSVGIGGLVMYGGFIGAILAGIIYFSVKKQPFFPVADAIAPGVAIGIFLTRIGCFLNGCCYGACTHSPLGVTFPADSPAGYYALQEAAHAHQSTGAVEHACALFPSQLLESVGGLVIAGIILLAGRKHIVHGFEFLLLGICYAVLRFFGDFTRYYSAQERLFSLTHNQIVCIVVVVVFGGLMLRQFMARSEQVPSTSAT